MALYRMKAKYRKRGGIKYKGTTSTPLSVARNFLAATTVGNYAIFGGGSTGTYVNTVDAYNTSLIRTTPTALSAPRYSLAATTVGNYAIFGGGSTGTYVNTVDAYDTSLTKTQPTALSNARLDLAATTVGNYAIFGGGHSSNGYSSNVDAYNKSLTRTQPTALGKARYLLAATTVGNYALFGGGEFNSGYATIVDTYDTSVTRRTPTNLSYGRCHLAATTVGNYALFGGGYSYEYPIGASIVDIVDAYDTSLTRTTPTALSVPRHYLAATTVGNYAIFGGGYAYYDNIGGFTADTVDAYDISLTRTQPTPLSVARNYIAATTIGKYALFGGGHTGNTYADTVEVYQAA